MSGTGSASRKGRRVVWELSRRQKEAEEEKESEEEEYGEIVTVILVKQGIMFEVAWKGGGRREGK